MDKDTLNIDSKSQLAKLLATENITVQQNNVKTASFDVVNRILTLPIFKTDSKAQTQNLQYKSIETPPPFSLKIDVDYK